MSQVVSKGDFVKKVAEKAGIPQKKANEVLNIILDTIVEDVAAGDKVTFIGFGKFEPVARAARAGRNPQTGEPIEIPAMTSPKFSAGKAFKEAVRK